MPIRPTTIVVLFAAALAFSACGDETNGDATGGSTTAGVPDDVTTGSASPTLVPTPDEAPRFPDVVEAEVTASGDGWSVAATISSPYDSPERYADAFRVLGPDGTELGVRELLHDHAGEQPFTRSTDQIAIPDDVDEVTVEGRDLANGWGGGTVTIAVPR